MPIEPDPVIEVYKARVDRSVLRERLKRTPAERVQDLVALLAAEELAAAGRPRDLESVAELEALREERDRQ